MLLRAVAKDGKTGVFARLVAVQPGVILREFPLPDNADPLAQAQALAKEFAPYWSKLAAIPKGKITALSLLGLRFDVDSPQTRRTWSGGSTFCWPAASARSPISWCWNAGVSTTLPLKRLCLPNNHPRSGQEAA